MFYNYFLVKLIQDIFFKTENGVNYTYKSFSELLVLVTIVMLRDILLNQGNIGNILLS